MYGWVGYWMYGGWIIGCLGGFTLLDVWVDRWIIGCMGGYIIGCMGGFILLDVWVDGWIIGCMVG